MSNEVCPFCKDGDPHIDEVAPGTWALVCPTCGAIGPHDPEMPQTPTMAYIRWRKRG